MIGQYTTVAEPAACAWAAEALRPSQPCYDAPSDRPCRMMSTNDAQRPARRFHAARSSTPSAPPALVTSCSAMTVAIYMITYMDRTIIASALPLIRKELGFSLITAGWILASFRWGFTLFQIPGAWFGDKIGPRRALAIIVTWWSIFTSLTTTRLERRVDDRHPLHFRNRRIGRIPHRHALALALDAPGRTRFRARNHACRLAPGRRRHAAAGRLDDLALRLAHALSHFRGARAGLGRDLVLLLSRLARTASRRQSPPNSI